MNPAVRRRKTEHHPAINGVVFVVRELRSILNAAGRIASIVPISPYGVRFVAPAETILTVRQEADFKVRFEKLMASYVGPVRRLCSVYATAPADREDLFQEIFMGVWRSLPAFRGDSRERTWIYRIAHNVALTWQMRDRRHQSRHTTLDDASQLKINAVGPRQVEMERALGDLNPADRNLTLLWLEGLTATEIEEVTGVQAATVAVRLGRIRKQLAPTEVKA